MYCEEFAVISKQGLLATCKSVQPLTDLKSCKLETNTHLAGKVEVPGDIAEELLQAADQYMLEGLKRLCEVAIARTLSVDSLPAAQEVCSCTVILPWRSPCSMCQRAVHRSPLTFVAPSLG